MSKRRNRSVSKFVTELQATSDRMTPEQRVFLEKYVAEWFPAEVAQMIEEMTQLPAGSGPTLGQLVADLRQAIKAGFVLAIARYSRELKGNAEAMAIINKRSVGVAKGHETQTRIADEKAQKIRDKWAEMEAAGGNPTNDTVATATGCSRSTVIRAFKTKQIVAPRPSRRGGG